jgi:hypothetical protein
MAAIASATMSTISSSENMPGCAETYQISAGKLKSGCLSPILCAVRDRRRARRRAWSKGIGVTMEHNSERSRTSSMKADENEGGSIRRAF